MKQILIQLDDATAARLEKVAPGKSRKRSEFLRKVIARALQDTVEARTRKAYEQWPDVAPPLDASEWADEKEAIHRTPRRERRRTSHGKTRRSVRPQGGDRKRDR